jgi:hypothetical protein
MYLVDVDAGFDLPILAGDEKINKVNVIKTVSVSGATEMDARMCTVHTLLSQFFFRREKKYFSIS